MMVEVRLHVVNEAGEPIAGAIVRRLDADDADVGQATDPAGFATVSVRTGFDAITVFDEVTPAEAELTFSLSDEDVGASTRTVMLRRGAPLAGTVTDPTGMLIEGATVEVWSERGRLFRGTDKKGAWLVRAMCPGLFEVRAGADGYARGPTFSGSHDGRTAVHDVALSVATGATLAGRVVGDDDEPVVGARVFTQVMPGDDGTAITDTQGFYAIRGLESGRRSVEAVGSRQTIVFPDGVAEYKLDIRAPFTNVPEAAPRCHRPARPELERPATVTGRVVREGKPVENYVIALRGEGLVSGHTTIDGIDGRFALVQQREWTCAVNVFALGSTWTRTPPFALQAATIHDLGDIELVPGARVAGVVRDIDGKPVAGGTVSFGTTPDPQNELEASASGYYRTHSLDDGSFLFESVYIAERTVSAASHDSIGTSRSVPIETDAAVELILLPTGAIDGALEQAGRITGLLLHGQTPGCETRVCDVRPSGVFAIEGIVPGDYTLEVLQHPRWPRREISVTVIAGQRAFARIPAE